MLKYFTAKDGRKLAFDDSEGGGPTILCLAGLTRNRRDFDDLAAHLAPRYRVLRLDSRGRGASEHAEDPMAEYAVPTEAADAIALLDHLSIDRVALIGTSRGGILCMAIAGAQPDRVASVVLNDVGGAIEGRGLLRILATLGRPPQADTFEAAAAALRSANEHEFPDVPGDEWLRHAHRLYDDAGGRPTLSYDPKLRQAVVGAIDDAGPKVLLWPLFDALKGAPVLVIRGENSDILAVETMERMQAEHPRLTALTLANRGHAPFLNEPQALAAIDAFLDATAMARMREEAPAEAAAASASASSVKQAPATRPDTTTEAAPTASASQPTKPPEAAEKSAPAHPARTLHPQTSVDRSRSAGQGLGAAAVVAIIAIILLGVWLQFG